MLLSGIVGSTAYGLAHEESDIDRLGTFAAPTEKLHGLARPKESIVTYKPDATQHEARKYCELALKCNPTVTELMWLPDELYEVRTALGGELIGIRTSFLSASYVRNAYLGYATQQFKKLEARGDGTFGPDLTNRTAKRARHMNRLLIQGLQLWSQGELSIRLTDPEAVQAFGALVADGDIGFAKAVLQDYEYAFNNTKSVLPERPDRAAVEAWLHQVRDQFYVPRETSRPRVLGLTEAAECLGVSRQFTCKLRRDDPAFPAVLDELLSGPVWLAEEMEHYAQTRNRTPGRKPNVPRETKDDHEQ